MLENSRFLWTDDFSPIVLTQKSQEYKAKVLPKSYYTASLRIIPSLQLNTILIFGGKIKAGKSERIFFFKSYFANQTIMCFESINSQGAESNTKESRFWILRWALTITVPPASKNILSCIENYATFSDSNSSLCHPANKWLINLTRPPTFTS